MEPHLSVPNEIWNIILGYLEINELKETVSKQQTDLQQQKDFIEETFVYTDTRLRKITKELRRVRRKIDNCISFLDYSGNNDTLVSDMDGYTLDLRGEIQSLYSVIQNLRDVSSELRKDVV